MRVLQVNKFYPPVVGGIENAVEKLSVGLVESGHKVRALVASESRTGSKETRDGVTVYRTANLMTVLSTPSAPAFPFHLRHLANWADVIHYHLPSPISVASHLLVRPDTPSVVTYHSDIVRQRRALRIYTPLLNRFLSDVDHIITTSPCLAENSRFLPGYAHKTSVVPLSIDLEEQLDGPSESLPITADGPILLFVGRLNYYKGLSVLLDAIASIESDATLLVVGDGPQRQALEQRAEGLQLSDDVKFLGQVNDATLRGCYERADIFILPSVEPSEAFGIVQLEAMAHGRPVINTNLPTGVPWVSPHEETGLTVPPNDAEALADAIDVLLRDAQRRLNYGRNGRERVASMFTTERMIPEIETIYQSVLNQP